MFLQAAYEVIRKRDERINSYFKKCPDDLRALFEAILKELNLEINEENINKNLDTANIPDVDLLIRTSGEIRISNYLLWQAAYSELFFSNTLWPDFNSDELDSIIKSFDTIERRFGDAK